MTDTSTPPGFVPTGDIGGFHGHIGPFFMSSDGPPWRMGLHLTDRHTNPHGVADGGLLMSLADHLIGMTIFRSVENGTQAVTISLNSDFLGAGRVGDWIEGSAFITRKTRELIFARAEIACARNPILAVSGVWKIVASRQLRGGAAAAI